MFKILFCATCKKMTSHNRESTFKGKDAKKFLVCTQCGTRHQSDE